MRKLPEAGFADNLLCLSLVKRLISLFALRQQHLSPSLLPRRQLQSAVAQHVGWLMKHSIAENNLR